MTSSLLLSVPLTLISVVGLLLNGYILVVVILTRQIKSANNILLFHLGTVDILLGILFLVFSLPGIKGAEWSTAGAPCLFHGFLFTLLHPLALWTICGLNCDRYYIIAAPLHYSHIVSPKKVLIGLGAGWALSLLLCIPPFFAVAPYTYIPGLGACGPDFSVGVGTLWYSTLYTAFTLLLPATVIICCNLKILMIARYHRHRIASAIYEVTLSAQVTITHQRNPFFVPTVTAPSSGGPKFRSPSAICSVFQLVGSFLVLYLPYYIIILWEATLGLLNNIQSSNKKQYSGFLHATLYTLASSLLISTLPVNGFLYGVKSNILKKTFQNYWRKKQTKSEVNQEIQARTPSTCGSRRPSLTPLGFFTRPLIQRRLSETLIDVNKVMKSPSKSNKIKRIASELTWRPPSTNSLDHSPKEEFNQPMKQASSCNTLQVPIKNQDVSTITEDEMYQKLKPKSLSPTKPSSTGLLLNKFFGVESCEKLSKKNAALQNVLDATPKRSPRILITRAFSEESDKTSNPNTPMRDMVKTHSNSATTLIERKWRQLRYKEENGEDGKSGSMTTKPLLDNNSLSNRSSESSETSETSSGRLCMNLDKKHQLNLEVEPGEDQLLLSWNGQKKYTKGEDIRRGSRSNLLKQTLIGMQSQEVVL